MPPVFRLRVDCDPADQEALLAFLRLDGAFAYPVDDRIEVVAVDAAGAEAPRELLSRLVDWLMKTDAPLSVALI